MKKYILLLFTLPTVFSSFTLAQNCTSCTQTISTVYNSAVYINPGEKLCITSTGQLNASLYLWGGEVCNEGTINSFIDMTEGVLINYNQITSGSNISVDKGVFTNYGNIEAGNLTMNGSDIVTNNNGTINAAAFQLIHQNTGPTISFTNNGVFNITSFLSDSTIFINNGSMVTSGLFTNSDNAFFYNNGSLQIGQNYTNKGYFYTECMIRVGGIWANNSPGIIEGPQSGCGGFTTTLSTSNYADFGANGSFLDMCDSSNVGSFNFNIGNIGPNVTYCSCQNICQTSAMVNEIPEGSIVFLYPNPVFNHFQFYSSDLFQNKSYYIYNQLGKVVSSGIFVNENQKIDISFLPKGAYVFTIENLHLKFFK